MIRDDVSVNSSIDGDLQDFLKNKGLLDHNISKHLDNSSDGDDNQNLSYSKLSSISHSSFDEADLFISNCRKINKLLQTHGHVPVELMNSDINFDSQTISVYIIDSWAGSILSGISELLEHCERNNDITKDASFSAWKDGLATDALHSAISDLQYKLLDMEKKDKSHRLKIIELGNIHFFFFFKPLVISH
jgi:hypothetical protein